MAEGLESDADVAAILLATLYFFGIAEGLGDLTFLGDAVEHLVTHWRTEPTFRRDMNGGNTAGARGE